eukprot:GCRY01001027.1.p1 GENE.GCRY01001027.1~~GCRY01001027.1.p1  ORF type:complete len:1046 (-),score=335.56 GCRY01001027.1:582-3719(-)
MIESIDGWLQIVYLGVAILFILTVSSLSDQRTATHGNMLGSLGMLIATVGVFIDIELTDEALPITIAVCVVGAAIGMLFAHTVKMTGMPQLVGMLNAFGGLAACLESIAVYIENDGRQPTLTLEEHNTQRIELVLGIIVGMVTFTGSLVACFKLNGTISGKAMTYPGRLIFNGLLLLATLVLGGFMFDGNEDASTILVIIVNVLSAMLGVLFVLGIGGADMPVVISALNSLSGWSGTAAGFMLNNPLLIISGSIVGSSGAILSYVMCNAMNRPFLKVMMGGFGETSGKKKKSKNQLTESSSLLNKPDSPKATTVNPEEAAEVLGKAKAVMIIPGYGMAVSHAQQTMADLCNTLKGAGIKVVFGIHPVAGRLPGHMNVLLAEANVPYTLVKNLEDSNEMLQNGDIDVVLTCGANDTINPIAQSDEPSSISGMLVIEAWKAKHTIVMKRSLGAGYAGVSNPLFVMENTDMLLGDAKGTAEKVLLRLKQICADKAPAATDVEMKAVKKAPVEEEVDLSTLPEPIRTIGVAKEIFEGETRVALTPDTTLTLRKRRFAVLVESGAGVAANFTDKMYEKMGAKIVDTADELFKKCDILLKVRAPSVEESQKLGDEKTVLSFVYPGQNPETLDYLTESKTTVLAMDMVPRISRSQALDALSSMAKTAGYRAVIEASMHFDRFFSHEITAAGETKAAKVLIIGAGVAGLSAIGTARKLGAEVRAFDTRPAARLEVESLGAEFLEVQIDEDGTGQGGYAKVMSKEFIEAEMALFKQQAREVDVIITTALIPGRDAPRLLPTYVVDELKPGSVVVDLAAEWKGNCELTRHKEVVMYNGVSILGFGIGDMVSRMASVASHLYSTNMVHALKELGNAEGFTIDKSNEVVRGMLICENGEKMFPPPKIVQPTPQTKPAPAPAAAAVAKPADKKDAAPTEVSFVSMDLSLLFVAVVLGLIAGFAPDSLISQLMIFVLANFIGYNVVWSVTSSLHTPLMSITNAVSGVVLLGGLVGVNSDSFDSDYSIFNVVACFVASVNIGGGFFVTQRMLNMFRLKKN